MNVSHRPATAEIYQTDLERHLFAPAPRRNGRAQSQLGFEPLADWLRDWWQTGLSRWKAAAEAWNLG